MIKKSATLLTLTKVILIIDNILDMGITGWHDGVWEKKTHFIDGFNLI